jgi:hypothetical protein
MILRADFENALMNSFIPYPRRGQLGPRNNLQSEQVSQRLVKSATYAVIGRG